MYYSNIYDEILMLGIYSLGGKCEYISRDSRWLNITYKNIRFSTYGMRLPLDKPENIDKADNKLFARTVFLNKNIPVIPWYLVNSSSVSILKENKYEKWVIKPINGKKGISVVTNINYEQVESIIKDRKNIYHFAEPFISGKLYRVLLLNYKVISAYKKYPPVIIGNGFDSVGVLIKRCLGDSYINDDSDIRLTLEENKISIDSIPNKGEKIKFTNVVNICRGATWENILVGQLKSEIIYACESAAKAIDLKLTGVDIIENKDGIFILEANPSPGLYGHVFETDVDNNIVALNFSIPQKILKEAILFFCEDIKFSPPIFEKITFNEYQNLIKKLNKFA